MADDDLDDFFDEIEEAEAEAEVATEQGDEEPEPVAIAVVATEPTNTKDGSSVAAAPK
eukprot:CAMPEP_0172387336 /NCGR_PEP_ID=MMETSP1061-20121228/4653_1 /TAXON_ID=37318 /ORGANISM="Pseudo-nitzschia pungens, Strain cf. pungens" /LENGTH=57 /DNA_ID=CAMNT_0013116937 /DNA_START=85 /DNA_END=255 /DNA_ORIENTATION=+